MPGLKNYKIIIGLSVIELLVIGYLTKHLLEQKQVLGQVIVNPINKEDLIFPSSSELKNFFEPKPGTIEHRRPINYQRETGQQTINSDSLNERYNYSINKPQGVYRIITLGDSHTFGDYIDTKDNYPEVLEDKLNKDLKCKNINKFEVINLGVGGYDLQYAAERFRLRGIKYNPDLVLWLLKTDDVTIVEELLKPIKERVKQEMEKSGEMEKEVAKSNYIPDTEKALAELNKKYPTKDIVDHQLKELVTFRSNYLNPLVIFTYPRENSFTLNQFGQFKRLSETFPKTYYFDQLPDLQKMENMTFPDGHPNEKGYALMAENLYKYLTATKVIPCN